MVSAVTANSFTATLAFAHDGTGTPFPIVNDPSLPAAIDALGLANQQVVQPFFAQYPELLPLYTGFVATNEPIAQRYTDLLASFLPTLKRERKVQQALSRHLRRHRPRCQLRHRAAAGCQCASTPRPIRPRRRWLISPASRPAGLSASIDLDGDPAGANQQTCDISSAIQFAQIAVLSGTLAAGATVTTTIDGVAVPYDRHRDGRRFPNTGGQRCAGDQRLDGDRSLKPPRRSAA